MRSGSTLTWSLVTSPNTLSTTSIHNSTRRLGAARLRRPHVMCLDEPTSEFFLLRVWIFFSIISLLYYLYREYLASLIKALEVFKGGVLVITPQPRLLWVSLKGSVGSTWRTCWGFWPQLCGRSGSWFRIDKAAWEEEDQSDAMGNKIDSKKAQPFSLSFFVDLFSLELCLVVLFPFSRNYLILWLLLLSRVNQFIWESTHTPKREVNPGKFWHTRDVWRLSAVMKCKVK